MTAENQTLPVLGLVSDPGPFTAAPDGALYEAENVCIRKPGVIEPRGQFRITLDPAVTSDAIHVGQWNGANYTIYQSGTMRRGVTDTVTGGPSNYTPLRTWSVVASDRFLFTSDEGVYAVDSTATTVARRAGVPVAPAFAATIAADATPANNWMAATVRTAYRIVYVRYSGTTPMLSAPSNYTLADNDIGAAGRPTLRIFPTQAAIGDEIQIYRADKLTATDPADSSMRLRAVLTLTNGGTYPYNAVFTWNDTLDDDKWDGAALYTNAGQEGIAMANLRPYFAGDVETYNGMTFYGAHTSPHRVGLSIRAFAQPNVSGADQSFATFYEHIGITAGSPTMTVRDNGAATKPYVGQIVTRDTNNAPGTADAWFAADTYITAVSGPAAGVYTVTLSKNALSTQAYPAVDGKFWDWIGVDDGTTVRRVFAAPASSGFLWNTAWKGSSVFLIDDATGGPLSVRGGAQDLARAWEDAHGTSGFRLYWTGNRNTDAQLTWERTAVNGNAFTVKSTKPLAFDRYVDSSTGIASAQDGGSARLAWSKYGQPEAVPEPQFVDLGTKNNTIYRIARLRDSLFVFTQEGIYRINGDSADALSVFPFDQSIQIATFRVLGAGFDALWAWTNRGILRITEGGYERIDEPVRLAMDAATSLGLTQAPSAFCWVMVSEVHGVVVFGDTQYGTDSARPWRAWVYNVDTGAWSRWSGRLKTTCAVFRRHGTWTATVGVTGGYADYYYSESTLSGALPTVGDLIQYDPIGTGPGIEVTANAGTSLTITAPTRFNVAVGDAIADANPPHWITAKASPTSITIDRDTIAPGTYSYLLAAPASVQWIGNAEGDPNRAKLWQRVMYAFDRFRRGLSITFTFYGYHDNQTQSIEVTYTQEAMAPKTFNRPVPRILARNWGLRVGFQQPWAGAFFSTAGLKRVFADGGERMDRS